MLEASSSPMLIPFASCFVSSILVVFDAVFSTLIELSMFLFDDSLMMSDILHGGRSVICSHVIMS